MMRMLVTMLFFDWGAGFGADGIGDEVAQEYYMQIQWSHTEYSPEWHYINMADNKYGLVKYFVANYLMIFLHMLFRIR